MADLTSTIKITGTINGQKISVTSVMTLTDIYDAGVSQPGDSELSFSTIGFGTVKAATFEQDCPSYLFVTNRSPSEPSLVKMTNTGNTAMRYMLLPPGGFIVLNEYENGAGMLNVAGALPTTLEGISSVEMDVIPDIGFTTKNDQMVAFQAAS